MESWILIILVIMPGVWSGDWRVTFKSQCALNGTSVVLKCEYDYPDSQTVTSVRWYKVRYVSGMGRLYLVTNHPSSPDHFRYAGNLWSDCSLKINDVQNTDEGQYYFQFETKLYRWTSRTYSYLSVKELTAYIQPGTVTEGADVSLTCKSGCDTPVNIVWFKDGLPVLNPVFRARREDAGQYHCAILGQESVRSASVALDVHYQPVNISVLMSPPNVVAGSSVNMTCSGAANPAAETYTWYRRTASFTSVLQVGSGQVLSIPSVEASHTGLYSCQAGNRLGESNSTEVLLIMKEEQHGGQSLPIIAGIGISLFVTLVLALLLLWRKQRTHAEEKQTVSDSRLSGRVSSSTATEEQSNSIYVNIHTFPSCLPPATDVTPHNVIMAPVSCEDEVTYSTVTIKPRNPHPPHHRDNNSALQDSRSKASENDESVIYATVAKSR